MPARQRTRDLDATATRESFTGPTLPPDVAALAARYGLRCFCEDDCWHVTTRKSAADTGPSSTMGFDPASPLHEIESIFRDTAD